PNWTVRAALATVLAGVPAEIALPRLNTMLSDVDQRVIPPVLSALIKLRDPKAPAILLERLKTDDVAVRSAAAAAIGELKPQGGIPALAAAYSDSRMARTSSARPLSARSASTAAPKR